MPAKTHPRANRFIAALLAVFMLVSVCSIGVYADADADARALKEQISAEIDTLEHTNWDSSEQYIAAYQALCQKYPDRPDVALKYLQCSNSDRDAKLAALDHIIELAENYPSPAYFVEFGSADSIIRFAYEQKSEIYLATRQQENYISAMRGLLDAKERMDLQALSSEHDWFDNDWFSAIKDLQKISANRAELDAIEQWYKAGSPLNFTTLNGLVQVTASEDNHSIQVQMQVADTIKDRAYFPDSSTHYSSVTLSLHCSPTYCQPVSTVMRSLDGVTFYSTINWGPFLQDTVSLSTDEWDAEAQSLVTTTTTYHSPDGTSLTHDCAERISLDYLSSFCNIQSLSLPDAAKDYLKQNYPTVWDAGGDTTSISYSASIVGLGSYSYDQAKTSHIFQHQYGTNELS